MLSLTAQRVACETCILSIGGSVPLGPNFMGMGSSPSEVSIPCYRQLIVLQFCHWKLSDTEIL